MGASSREGHRQRRNPYYDDVTDDGIADGRVANREGYILLGLSRGRRDACAGPRADGGRGRRSLRRPITASRPSGTPSTPARRSSTPACSDGRAETVTAAGGSSDPFLGAEGQGLLRGRDSAVLHQPCRPGTGPASSRLPSTRTSATRSSRAFQNLTDPANPGKQVVLDDPAAGMLRTSTAPTRSTRLRSGDVVVVLRPPYQYDAATPGTAIAFSQFFGQHGYLPTS